MAVFFLFAGKAEWLLAAAGLFGVEFLVVFWYGRKVRGVWSWPLLGVAAAWLLTAGWEWVAAARGYAIRADVFMIYPVLFAVTAAGFLLSVGSLVASLFRRGERRKAA